MDSNPAIDDRTMPPAAERPQLSLTEQLADAVRVRSPKQGVVALLGAAASRIAPQWWKELPWSVGRAIETFGLSIRLDRNRFTLPEGPNTLLKGMLWLGRYETLERHAVLRWLPPDRPVVELGASIGVVSCLVNQRLNDPIRHVCVEANPAVVPVLTANRDANGCRFQIVHGAIAYGSDVVAFGASEAIVDSTVLESGTGCRIPVPSLSLGQIVGDTHFTRCTLICDIEGAEEALLAHEAQILRDAVETVLIEVHPDHLGKDGVDCLFRRFAEVGFGPRWHRGAVWVLSKDTASPV